MCVFHQHATRKKRRKKTSGQNGIMIINIIIVSVASRNETLSHCLWQIIVSHSCSGVKQLTVFLSYDTRMQYENRSINFLFHYLFLWQKKTFIYTLKKVPQFKYERLTISYDHKGIFSVCRLYFSGRDERTTVYTAIGHCFILLRVF